MTSDTKAIYFSRGVPPLEAIPTQALAEIAAAVLKDFREVVFQYAPLGKNPGEPTLREQIGRFHGVDPERIFIGNGSLQVLDLLASHFLREGNPTVYVEAPTYDRAVQIFERHGGRVLGLPLEKDGLDIAALKDRLRVEKPAFLYVIPDFQNPSGITTSEPKRHALIELARRFGFTIVEDIPYRELRYHGTTPPLLSEIAGEARVITVGSLTKTLSPGLRVGYAVSDRATSLSLASLAENTYLSPAPLCQAIATRCLSSGLVRANIDRVRDLLRPRHDAAVSITRALLGDALIAEPDGGYFLSVHLRTEADEASLLERARAEGLILTPGSAFYPPETATPRGTLFVRLPFQALSPDEFGLGVERLARLAGRISGRPHRERGRSIVG